ncbi:MAG: hypothetical protein FWF15_11925 [Oscillospiraceae bacterium]|nr:hypothetical protein [Oscillospiraceae bacterium]
MMEPKNLNSEIIYADGIYMLSNVERLPDGRLFTIGVMPRDRIFDPPLGAPKTQLILGRISNDDGHTR